MEKPGSPYRVVDGQDGPLLELTAGLTAGRLDEARRLFHDQGSRAPSVLWDPSPLDIGHPAMRTFMARCRAKMVDGGVLRADAVALSMEPAIDQWLIVVRPEANGHFRYVKYGSGVRDHYGRDMTGRSTRDFPGHISLFFTALYRASIARRQSALSAHEPPDQVFVRSWRRLITPIYHDDDSAWGLAVVNIPDNDLRAGLEALPDPVVLCKNEGDVVFANAAAQHLFGDRSFAADPCPLASYIGVEVPLDADAGPAGFDSGAEPLRQSRHVGERLGLIVHFEVTRSTVLYRNRRFWVVVVKPS